MRRDPLPVLIFKVVATLTVFVYLLHALTSGTDEVVDGKYRQESIGTHRLA